ncbi:Outer membrane receptor proteins, mostly Fe transport [Polaribacter sp. KT25b]|uniref:outer membrane beta-barrel protein n=1 Tax=Polaribacter sp. KT25b TaxID=1855336 RepID=UPI00087A52CD|nr:outer membrane beta-barrel protein [Polaribacter sp. KT25b]SDR68523.1 Outer membrane receptor proteins, mostly Fe transport [Polaribacter sp. KT25b]
MEIKKGILKAIMFVLFVFCFSTNYYSQKTGIIGVVVDDSNQPLEMVSVALLSTKESLFLSYTTTDVKGAFHIDDIPKDSILLQLNFLGFTTYSKKIIYKKKLIDLDTIVLKEDISSLDEIVISAVVPVQIKKDTVSFNANSFKVNYDDNIDGLLSKLPGIEIDENGSIVTQGTTVTKVMIDGKEFFGGDPSIVMKNISADAIAKVEIIDKKSDEAELTGVSDGNKEIVINFRLKKEKKNRGFGKLSAGVGLDNRYFGNINYNQFNTKNQLSIIGKFNNINITGSNIQGFLENADGVADDSGDDTDGDFSNNKKSLSGFLITAVTGVHFGTEIKKKESLSGDYFYNSSENSGLSETNRISFTSLNNFNFKSKNNFLNTSENHNLNFNYENKSSKKSSLSLRGLFYSDDRNYKLDRGGSYFNTDEELVTENNLSSENSNLKKFGNINFNYYQRLQKKGRSFNVGFNTVITSLDRENNQNMLITRGLNTSSTTMQEVITFRNEDNSTQLFNLRFKYTEPLGGNHYLNTEVFADFLTGKEQTNQFRKTIKTTTVEDLLEINYNYFQNIMKSKISHSYNTSKLNISSALELQNLRREFGQEQEEQFIKEQLFFNPSIFFQYKPQRGRKYKFVYKKLIKAPRPSQTNPFVNDLNPYFIKTGNVDLKPEKVNSFQMLLNINDLKTSLGFNAKLQYNHTKDAIIRNITIDDDFIRASSYQNNGKKEQFKAEGSFTKKLSKLGIRLSLKNKYLYNSSNSIINFNLNTVVSEDFSTNFIIQNIRKNKVDLKAGVYYSENNTGFSIEKDLDRKFTTQKYFGMIDFDVTKKFNFNTQLDYIFYEDNSFSIHQEIPVWNAAISYSLSKSNNIFKLVFIDLLDKNVDVFRRSTLNFFEETTSQSLGRYIILSYTYKLNGIGKKKKSAKA